MKKTLMTMACVFSAIATVAGNKLPAADELDGKVDAFVQSELHRQHIPGVAVGVYRDGQLTKAKATGWRT